MNIAPHTDNAGAEAGLNRLFSARYPMNRLLTRVSFVGLQTQRDRVPGVRDHLADALSRWRGHAADPLPKEVSADRRIRFFVRDLWQPAMRPSNLRPRRFLL